MEHIQEHKSRTFGTAVAMPPLRNFALIAQTRRKSPLAANHRNHMRPVRKYHPILAASSISKESVHVIREQWHLMKLVFSCKSFNQFVQQSLLVHVGCRAFFSQTPWNLKKNDETETKNDFGIIFIILHIYAYIIRYNYIYIYIYWFILIFTFILYDATCHTYIYEYVCIYKPNITYTPYTTCITYAQHISLITCKKRLTCLRPQGRGRKLAGQGEMCIERICGATFWVSFFDLKSATIRCCWHVNSSLSWYSGSHAP